MPPPQPLQPSLRALRHAGWITVLLAALCCSGILLLSQTAAASPLLLKSEEGQGSFSLDGHLELLEDTSGKMGLREVIESKAFREIQGSVNEGFSGSAFWVRFRVVRGEGFPASAWLRLGPRTPDTLEAYVQQQGTSPLSASSYKAFPLGLTMPPGKRAVPDPQLLVPLELGPEGSELLAYMRIASRSPVQLRGTVLNREELMKQSRSHMFLQAFYLGVTAVIVLMSLLIFFAVREWRFLFFSLYAADLFLSYLIARGMYVFLMPWLGDSAAPELMETTGGLGVVFFALFAYEVLKDKCKPTTLRALQVTALAGLLDPTASLLFNTTILKPFGAYSAIALLGVLFWITVRQLPLHPFRKQVLLGLFGLNILLYGEFFLQRLGLLPLNTLLQDLVQAGSFMHILVIFGLLVERFLHAEQELKESTHESEVRATAIAEKKTEELRTYRDRLEQSLQSQHQSAERVRRFFQMVSHEYRTPLAIIQGNISILSRRSHPGDTKKPIIFNAMHRAAGRLLEVMEQAVERSRLLETDDVQVIGRIRVSAYMFQQVESARALWPKLHIIQECLAGNEEIEGDLLLLQMALFNLLDNARKYSPEGSPVHVRCRAEEGFGIIELHNNTALPMDEDEGELFMKFHRGNNSAAEPGKGIGLWLVREVMRQHDGSATLKSGKRGGVTATIRIPLAQKENP